jgi:hypothetical protein
LNDAARFNLAINGIVGRRLTYADLTGETALNAPDGN